MEKSLTNHLTSRTNYYYNRNHGGVHILRILRLQIRVVFHTCVFDCRCRRTYRTQQYRRSPDSCSRFNNIRHSLHCRRLQDSKYCVTRADICHNITTWKITYTCAVSVDDLRVQWNACQWQTLWLHTTRGRNERQSTLMAVLLNQLTTQSINTDQVLW